MDHPPLHQRLLLEAEAHGSLVAMQSLRLHPGFAGQNLCFNKICRWFRVREYCWRPGSRGPLGSPTVGQAVAECRSFGTGRETNSGVLPDDKSWGGKCRERFVYILHWGRSIDSDGAGGA